MKRFLSLLLTLTMLFICIPTGLIAEDVADEAPAVEAVIPEAPAPTEEEAPAPAEEEAPAPAEEEAPAPAEEEAPAPTEEEAPAPTEEEAPAPTEEEAPAPTEEEAPAPAEEEVPAPAEEEAPAPAEEEVPAPAEEEAPAPAEEEAPAPAEEEAPALVSDFEINDSVLTRYNGNDENVVIPDGIKIIGSSAFEGNRKIVTVTLPDSVETIDSYAFADCVKLERVILGSDSALKTIGSHAFANDTLLDTGFVTDEMVVDYSAFAGTAPEDEELDIDEDTVEENVAPAEDETTTNSGVVIDQQPTNVYAAEGATVSFTVVSANATAYQWKYSMNGGGKWYSVSATSSTLSGGKTNTLSFVLNTTRAGWLFKCVVSNATGSGESNVVSAVIAQLPVVNNQPVNVEAEEGAMVSFEVVSLNATSYQWQYSRNNGGSWSNVSATSTTFSGAREAVLTFPLSTTRASWLFKCVLTNAAGSTDTDTVKATIIENDQPVIGELPVIDTQPESVGAAIGEEVVFTVLSSNTDSYQWQYSSNGGTKWNNVSATSSSLHGGKTNTLSFTQSATRANWLFKCVLTNAAGSTETDVVNSKDGPSPTPTPPTPPVIDVQPENVTVAIGEEVVFTVVSSNTDSYQWQYSTNGGGKWTNVSATSSSLHGGKTNSLTFTQSATRAKWLFRCVLTNEAGNTESNEVKAIIPQPPVIDVQPENVTADIGEEVIFTVVSSNTDSYQWQYSTNGGVKWTNVSATSSSLHGGKTNTLSFTQSSTRAKWLFKCVLTNDVGSTISEEVKAELPIGPLPPVIDVQPVSVMVAIGEEVVFTVVSSNTDSYQWQYSMNGGGSWTNVSATSSSLHGGKTNTLSFTQSATRAKWLFKCVLTNTVGPNETQEVQAFILSNDFTVDGITYHRIDDANVSVTSVNTSAEQILIPATVANPDTGTMMTVNQIAENAFDTTAALIYQQTSVNSCKVLKYTGSASIVSVPTVVACLTVTAIGADAFLNKSSLVSISLPNTITVIGARAFKGCTSLSTMTNHN